MPDAKHIIPFYQVDAFTSQPFQGNSAAVCPLPAWLPDDELQRIAMENNLSETAFFVWLEEGLYELRWFTPTLEVELCGHATLATAHVLFAELGFAGEIIRFRTRKRGDLIVQRMQSSYQMSLPSNLAANSDLPVDIQSALGVTTVVQAAVCDNWLIELTDQTAVQAVQPDFVALAKTTPQHGIMITARGDQVDFVSRFFAPAFGIDEDPVTGSAHATLVPYWANKLSKHTMQAEQISQRGGALSCQLQDDRVLLVGDAVTVIVGQLFPAGK